MLFQSTFHFCDSRITRKYYTSTWLFLPINYLPLSSSSLVSSQAMTTAALHSK